VPPEVSGVRGREDRTSGHTSVLGFLRWRREEDGAYSLTPERRDQISVDYGMLTASPGAVVRTGKPDPSQDADDTA